jgi:PASTA domain
MARDKGPWQDGRRAWERLNGWHQDSPSATPGHPDNGVGAVEALADIGLVRHLLDQAELVAVRTARRHGKSWAEIATKLGVTRQSAWERWRDLDDEPNAQTGETGPEAAIDAAVSELTERQAREHRRESSIKVPNVIGLTWDAARLLLLEHRLVAVGPDPDGPPLAAIGWPSGTVTDQSPESGAKVPPGSPVTLWLDAGAGGGSAGVREPRRPKPSPRGAREMRYEPSDEAVG